MTSIEPCTLADARRFVGEHHRHNLPPRSGLFAARVVDDDGNTLGVGIAGRPVARMLDDGQTIEITRIATTGTANACSRLYGALCRASKALGYRRAVTYTLASEPGASLKASGFIQVAELPPRGTWSTPSRPRVQTDLFGNQRRPPEAKRRWERTL